MIWVAGMILLAVLLSSDALALGITPGRTVLEFEPGKTKEIKFTILNNENKDMKVIVYSDEGNRFLDIKPTVITLGAKEPSKDFTFNFKATGQLNPGMNELKIMVKELPEGYGEKDAAKITATMELIHQLRINVPYPGKYAESDVYITSNDAEKPVLFTIPIFNMGKERIGKAKATIEIFDVNGNSIAVIETNEISLESGKEGKVVAELSQKLGRGRYNAKIHLAYDDNVIDMEKEFFVGVPLINVNGVTVDSNFRLGNIARFSMLLENMWNQGIEGIFSDIRITDSNNREMTRFKTASADIDANSIGVVDAYWDTKDVDPGVYRMSIALHYLNLVNEKVYDMDVGFDSIKMREYGGTGAVVAARGSGADKNIILGTALFILVVMNIAIILYFRKKIIKPKEQKEQPNLPVQAPVITQPDEMNGTEIKPQNDYTGIEKFK